MYIFKKFANTFIKKFILNLVFIGGQVMKKKSCSKIKYFLIGILLIFFVFFNAFSYVRAVSTDISNSVFRLHVIANSDTEEDQLLKYKVRDKIISYMKTISPNFTNKEAVKQEALIHQKDLKEIAEQVIQENGYNYSVVVKIGNFSFPTKTYGDISLPAGYYDAIRIEIGSASGQNWWCVMFPPLCFVDVSSGVVPNESKELIKDNLSNEEYDLISNNTSDIKLKFKLIELFQNNKITTAKN